MINVIGPSGLPQPAEAVTLPPPLPPRSPKLPLPTTETTTSNISFKVKEIGQEVLAFFASEQWMSFVTDMLAIASHICALMEETRATELVPYIGIISGPLYLYHAVQSSIQRIKLMVLACKTSRIADAFFWGIGAVGSFGLAVGNVIKPIAGGVAIFGIKNATLHLVLSFVIPIILITFSVIGGGHQAWARGKTELAQIRLQERCRGMRSLKRMEAVLNELLGPQEPADKDSLAHHEYTLDLEHFQNTYFTKDCRREAIQKKIEALLHKEESEESARAHVALDQMLCLLVEAKDLATATQGTLFEKIDKSIALSNKTIKFAEAQGKEVNDLIIEGRDELVGIREQLLQDGFEIIESVESEIDRKMVMQNIGILNALISLGVGILFLIGPQSQYYLGYVLSISCSAMGALSIVFDKGVSRKQFLQLERSLGTIRKLPISDMNGVIGHRRALPSGRHKDLP